MELIWGSALGIVGSYFLGAIPFGLVISKIFYNTDIRQWGSKNVGATNVWRVLGKKPGLITLLFDIAKGYLPVFLFSIFFPKMIHIKVLSGISAIAGHNWSIFLKGKGGKGVATSAGVFLALIPVHTGIALGVFLIFFLSTRHVSVGSMAGAVALLGSSFLIPTEGVIKVFIMLASVMIFIKHVPNMRRLARGEEPKLKL